MALLVAAAGGRVQAQGRRPDIRWEAPEGCPTADEFRGRVGATVRAAIARVVVRAADDGWTAWMVIDGDVRELAGQSCAELASAAALVVRIGLRAYDAARIDAPEAPAVAVPPSSTAPSPAADLVLGRFAARSTPGRAIWSVGTGLGVSTGALPGPAPRVRVGVSVRGVHVAAGFDAALAAGQRDLEGGGGASIGVRLLTAGARLCGGRRWAWLCAGVDAGRMRATVDGATIRSSAGGAWIDGWTGPALVLHAPRDCEVVVHAAVGLPLLYPRFTMRGVTVHDPGGFALESSLTVQRRFW
ncbi:MAG TPA: hypothetical protein VL172_17770 [Kofleriaceae bacterium]|nr:hypothetical protein [Kofleriaceae bacterium]